MGRSILFYTPEEFASLANVSSRTVRRWIGAGSLPARRFGHQLRILTKALHDFGQPANSADQEGDWPALATDSFGKDWHNEKDAQYDRWRQHYGLPKR